MSQAERVSHRDVLAEQTACFEVCDYDNADGDMRQAVHVRTCGIARGIEDARYVDGEVRCPHCGGRAEVPEFRARVGFARPRILPCGICHAQGFVPESVADAYEPPAEDDEDPPDDFDDDVATLKFENPHPAVVR